MATHVEKALAFRALHEELGAFVVPNAWDAGTARILGALGFRALATTSAGLAFALGRRDGAAAISREETLANARAIAEATDLPVSADLENGFAHEPQAAAATIRLAADAGVVGGSIEDSTGDPSAPIYDFDLAVERIAAAVAVARSMPFPFTLTARAENFLHGRRDVADTIRRLQAYEAAGADVLYAPGLSTLNEIKAITSAVSRPVNVVMGSWNPDLTVDQLAAAGVKRISVGGALARAALSAFIRAAIEIRDGGTFIYTREAAPLAQINALLDGEKS